jgi:hypothetical protein
MTGFIENDASEPSDEAATRSLIEIAIMFSEAHGFPVTASSLRGCLNMLTFESAFPVQDRKATARALRKFEAYNSDTVKTALELVAKRKPNGGEG